MQMLPKVHAVNGEYFYQADDADHICQRREEARERMKHGKRRPFFAVNMKYLGKRDALRAIIETVQSESRA